MPRGFGEPGLSGPENVKKEMLEETGIEPSSIEYLGRLYTDTGVMNSAVEYYLARIDTVDGRANDHAEGIDGFTLLSFDEFRKMIADGSIKDGFSLHAYALAAAKGLL